MGATTDQLRLQLFDIRRTNRVPCVNGLCRSDSRSLTHRE